MLAEFTRPTNLAAAILLSSAVAPLASGCSADGPWTRLSSLNPAVRQQWKEDEQRTTTFYQRTQQLQQLESDVGRLSAEEQAKVAAELNELVRNEANPLLRARAVRILGKISHPTAEVGLNMAESDSSADVRQEICRVRGAQRTRQGLRALARILTSDENIDVRMSATRELGNYRDPEAYGALATALNDNDPALQNRAMASLARATGKDLGGSVAAWQKYLATGEQDRPQSSWARRLGDWF